MLVVVAVFSVVVKVEESVDVVLSLSSLLQATKPMAKKAAKKLTFILFINFFLVQVLKCKNKTVRRSVDNQHIKLWN